MTEQMLLLLTGGGTAGHVTPNIALVPRLRALGFEPHYAGTAEGIERALAQRAGLPFHPIHAGKLRRYLTPANLRDAFGVARGLADSLALLGRLRPALVLSKGGFVSCPVVWAAWLLRIPVVLHESDLTPGLANKLSVPFARAVCFTFPETERLLPPAKRVWTGLPVRAELPAGDPEKGRAFCGFTAEKPVVLVMGGSQGAGRINEAIRAALRELLARYQIAHICGEGKADSSLSGVEGYRQFGYVNEELPHLLAAAEMAVTRAGATTLFELLALRKPALLIPLSRQASRGDQIENARSFGDRGLCRVLPEEELAPGTLVKGIEEVYGNRKQIAAAMEEYPAGNGVEEVIKVIKGLVG